MITITDLCVMGIGTLLLIFWLCLYFSGNKYKDLIIPLNEKEFVLKDIYGVGFAFMNLIKYKYNSAKDKRLKGEIEIMYGGAKYATYYLQVIYAQATTFTITLLLLGFIFYGLSSGEIAILFVFIVMSFVCGYYFMTLTKKRILSRNEEMLREFANVVSKLALLVNAGMIIREAWDQVAYSCEGALFDEMKNASEEMRNGVSQEEALRHFSNKCVISEIKKFTTTITQSMSKGNSEIALELQRQSKEVWMLKKQNVKRQGEVAANKLMIPIVVMFIGILIMIIIPIFTNLGI